jgi:glycosyltransferase involved in cell wall biosynthesis
MQNKSNYGINFVPITSYFNYQPPTKLFEYLLSGLAVISTKTYENSKYINQKNGLLIEDTAEAFYAALVELNKSYHFYKEETIIESVIDYTWPNLVVNNLVIFLQNVIGE